MTYLVTARKWRPMRFDEVTAQELVTVTMKNAIVQNRIAHAYLFSGPSGVGKTTTARILAKAINCPNVKDGEPCNDCDVCREITEGRSLDVIEIDGASNRGIDEIRDLRESVRYAPSHLRYKVYIIDEVHMLTKEAFNALLKTLEEPPEYALFILATTEPHKVLPTILTRCQRFDFKRIEIDKIIERLRFIAKQEKISVDEESLVTIAKKGDGSMRDALSIFDQVAAFCGGDIKHEVVVSALSLVDSELFFKMTDLIETNDSKGAVELAAQVIERGYDAIDFLAGLSEHLRNLLIVATTGIADLVEASAEYRKRYVEIAAKFDKMDLLRLLKLTSEAMQQIKYVSQPRIKFEMTLLQLVNMERAVRIQDLMMQVDELKKKLNEHDPGQRQSFPGGTAKPDNGGLPDDSPRKSAAVLTQNKLPNAGRQAGKLPDDASSQTRTSESKATYATSESSFQEITVRWDELLLAVRKERIGVWSQLINLKPLGTRNGWLLLGAPNEVVIGMTKPYKTYIQDAIHRVLGARVAVDFIINNSEERTGEPGAGVDDSLVQFLKDEFGAEPID